MTEAATLQTSPQDLTIDLMLLDEALKQIPEDKRLAGLRLAAVRGLGIGGEAVVNYCEGQSRNHYRLYTSLLTDKAVHQLLTSLQAVQSNHEDIAVRPQ